MVVTALVFSGLSNPTWTVPEGRIAEIARALASLPRLDHDCESPSGLGYSGVRLDVLDSDGNRQSWIFAKGVAVSPSGCRRDADRSIERQLLEMGQGRVDPTLLEAMMR